jgi:hypothetical protein
MLEETNDNLQEADGKLNRNYRINTYRKRFNRRSCSG